MPPKSVSPLSATTTPTSTPPKTAAPPSRRAMANEKSDPPVTTPGPISSPYAATPSPSHSPKAGPTIAPAPAPAPPKVSTQPRTDSFAPPVIPPMAPSPYSQPTLDDDVVITKKARYPPTPTPSSIFVEVPGNRILDVTQIRSIVKTGLVKRIGGGGQGAVHQADHIATDQPVAVKFIAYVCDDWDDGRKMLANELRCQDKAFSGRGSRPDLILPAIDCYYGKDHGCLVTPYMEEGTFADLLEREYDQVGLPRAMALQMILAIAAAILHMWDSGILHRDLKTANLVLHWNEDVGEWEILVIDFGMATEVTDEEEIREGRGKGTLGYLSPERVDPEDSEANYTAADALAGEVFGLGKIALSIFRGHAHPRPSWDPRLEWDMLRERIGNSEDANLILSMIDDDVNKRPSLRKLVECGWPSAALEASKIDSIIGHKRAHEEEPETPVEDKRTTTNAVAGPSTREPLAALSNGAPPPKKKARNKPKKQAVQEPLGMALRRKPRRAAAKK